MIFTSSGRPTVQLYRSSKILFFTFSDVREPRYFKDKGEGKPLTLPSPLAAAPTWLSPQNSLGNLAYRALTAHPAGLAQKELTP